MGQPFSKQLNLFLAEIYSLNFFINIEKCVIPVIFAFFFAKNYRYECIEPKFVKTVALKYRWHAFKTIICCAFWQFTDIRIFKM